MEEIKQRGRGHGLGAPCTHAAAAFVEALTAEAEGAPQQVLETFMAARGRAAGNSDRVLWPIQSQGGPPGRGDASNPAQGKGDDNVQRVRGEQERGRGGDAGRRGLR